MPELLGPDGRPARSIQNRKEAAPPLGNAFGRWTDNDFITQTLPGGGVVQFDLSKLRTEDFRQMKDHYQINSSLAVLTFMQHQAQWHIECDDKKIRDAATEMLNGCWTTLNRGLSQANWAGYSPNVIEWENDLEGRSVVVNKIKDLTPEECRVNWKLVEGWAPPGRTKPKFKEYDGIKQIPGTAWPIPVDNTLWYPLLMENGNYYGKKLLRPAFQSWYFSILIHLFANRYYERFGEPVPVGRAPFEDEIMIDGTAVKGNSYMAQVLQQLRNRSVVVLPNEMSPHGSNNSMEYDYQLEYLESQMRGADFERYMTRLDEEMSIGLFTPILLLRTADVGSYNLGTAHMQMYQWMLNAINDDRAMYINKYLLSRWTDYNFSKKSPRPIIKFRRNGNISPEQLMGLLTALVQNDRAKPDIEELGQIAGLTLHEIKETLADPEADPDPAVPPTEEPAAASARGRVRQSLDTSCHTADVVKEIVNRVGGQARVQFKDKTFGTGKVTLGFKKRFEEALGADGVAEASRYTDAVYGEMDAFMENLTSVGQDSYESHEDFTRIVQNILEATTSRVTGIRV